MTDPTGEVHSYGVDIANREIYLHGQHGAFEEDPGVDYRMASTFIKNIRHLDAKTHSSILIHMHSIGGNWNDGMAIYDAISMCRSYVTILAYGQAESMSSIILQAADERIMTPNSYFMCHFGSSGMVGDYQSVQNAVKFEQSMTDAMLEIYTEQCVNGKFFKEHYKTVTPEKVKGFIRRKISAGDWYLNAHESVYYGFADGVVTSKKFGNGHITRR